MVEVLFMVYVKISGCDEAAFLSSLLVLAGSAVL